MKTTNLQILTQSRLFIIGLVIIIAAGAGYYSYNTFLNPNNLPEEGFNENNTFIDLDIPLITGDTLRLSDLKGDIIILNFMTPWCPGCKAQVRVLQQIPDVEGVSIVSVNVDPRYDISYLQDLAKELGITWYYGHLPEAALEYNVAKIPVVILIDPTGVIRYRGDITPLGALQLLINQHK